MRKRLFPGTRTRDGSKVRGSVSVSASWSVDDGANDRVVPRFAAAEIVNRPLRTPGGRAGALVGAAHDAAQQRVHLVTDLGDGAGSGEMFVQLLGNLATVREPEEIRQTLPAIGGGDPAQRLLEHLEIGALGLLLGRTRARHDRVSLQESARGPAEPAGERLPEPHADLDRDALDARGIEVTGRQLRRRSAEEAGALVGGAEQENGALPLLPGKQRGKTHQPPC